MARYRSSTAATARYASVAFVATLWLGLLIGVSFLATPVKFQAPSLTLATALEVGQATFALFTRVEWGLVVLLALAVAWGGRTGAQFGLWICAFRTGGDGPVLRPPASEFAQGRDGAGEQVAALTGRRSRSTSPRPLPPLARPRPALRTG
ncbi:hypothetical protein RSD66_04440 [Brevundimonas sp. S1H14]|uniref:hypothetical protein n=1 Tax=Brevundimonas sp. S1H14 TaxID=3078084 RepID=UPI0039E9B06B